MRTAAMVLGIVGGAIALILALFFMLGGIANSHTLPDTPDFAQTMGNAVLWGFVASMFVGGILGLVGGIISPRHSTAGGVMMLVAAILGFFCFVLLLLGGIFALVSGVKQEAAQQQPIQPPVQQPAKPY